MYASTALPPSSAGGVHTSGIITRVLPPAATVNDAGGDGRVARVVTAVDALIGLAPKPVT